MEVCNLGDPPLTKFPGKLRQEAFKELRVLSYCRRVPSEDLLFLTVYYRHHLRRILRSPLGEQVRHLIILNTAGFTQVNPPLQPVKSEGIFSVLHFHLDQLRRCPLQTHRRIKRRRKERSQHHIAASFHIFMEIILKQLPVLLGEYLHMIIVRQTIRMHPLRMNKRKLRQNRTDHRKLHHRRAYCFAFFHQLDLDLVISRFDLFRHIYVDPQAPPLIGTHDRFPVLQFPQKIRVQPGSRFQIIVVHDPVRGAPHRNLLDRPYTDLVHYRRQHSDVQTLPHKAVSRIRRLERYRLSP